jgi:hypothetical protein
MVQTTVDVRIPIDDDAIDEPTEYFSVSVDPLDAVPYRFADGGNLVTVLDNDGPTPTDRDAPVVAPHRNIVVDRTGPTSGLGSLLTADGHRRDRRDAAGAVQPGAAVDHADGPHAGEVHVDRRRRQHGHQQLPGDCSHPQDERGRPPDRW